MEKTKETKKEVEKEDRRLKNNPPNYSAYSARVIVPSIEREKGKSFFETFLEITSRRQNIGY